MLSCGYVSFICVSIMCVHVCMCDIAGCFFSISCVCCVEGCCVVFVVKGEWFVL